MRGARLKHVFHCSDAGRVETQRLVECLRALPSRKEGMRCEVRCSQGGGRACGAAVVHAACTGRA